MLEEKQLEIINTTFDEIKLNFPQAELGEVIFRDGDTWVDIIIPEELFGDEKLDDLIAGLGTDILMDYGYSILFHAIPPRKEIVAS